MGMGVHELLFTKRLSQARGGSLGDVLTIGRQWLAVEPARLDAVLGRPIDASLYCDNVLQALGAASVSALDASDYEGAQLVHDLNRDYYGDKQFDCILDFGSLEHVFDVPTALRNLARLCSVGGSVVHALPANNLLSHGFWQIGADVLNEFYCPENGFDDAEVFYASNLDSGRWWRVPRSKPGTRMEVASIEPVILMCRATKARDVERLHDIQQPFYRARWNVISGRSSEREWRRAALARRFFGFLSLSEPLYRLLRNSYHLAGLALGRSAYGLSGRRFELVEPPANGP